MRKFLQEFQAFISRGNVLDLAVAVIIGAAFSAIVNSLVKDLINPLLGFLLLAFVIFWLIKVVTGLSGRLEALAKADKKKAEEEAAAKPQVTPEDIALLREIRDLLKEASAKKS